MQLRLDQLQNRTTPPEPIRQPIKRWEDTEVLSRGQLMEQIMEINPGASLDFLADFGADELAQYLDHLLWLEQPRTAHAVWVRPADSPAVLARTRTY